MLHRPYIRNSTRAEVENRAEKNENGNFLDANTGKPIDKSYDLGHKPGHEYRYEKARAEREGLTQKGFNDRMNNPDYYQIEDPSTNRSHKYEMKTDPYQNNNGNPPNGNTQPNGNDNNNAENNTPSDSQNNKTTSSENTSSNLSDNINESSDVSESSNVGESSDIGESSDTGESSSSDGESSSGGEEGGQSM